MNTANRAPDPTRRFTERAAAYAAFRPGYPTALIGLLERESGLESGWNVADIGAGTGISTELFLDYVATVFAVEPNDAMRREAEKRLGGRPGFQSVPGTAEATGLVANSVDLVVAAQAFHWFDRRAAKAEFRRILRPGGKVVLMWNTRRTSASGFMRAYEAMLHRHGTDYQAVRHDRIRTDALATFFDGAFEHHTLTNDQRLTYEALEGRLISASYTPPPGDPRFEPMIVELRRIFAEHEEGGRVAVAYDTEVYIGSV